MTTLRYMSRFLGNKPELRCRLASQAYGQMLYATTPPASLLLPPPCGQSTTTIETNKVLCSMNVGRPSETWIAATAATAMLKVHTARVNLNLLGLTDIRRQSTDVSVNRRSVRACGDGSKKQASAQQIAAKAQIMRFSWTVCPFL